MIKRFAPALLVLALGACGNDNTAKELGGKAEGQILPGSVSDEMIPVDQVKSQPPLAPKTEGGDKKDARAKPGNKASAAPATSVEPAPEPAPAEDAATE
jgi:hypothetical protein